MGEEQGRGGGGRREEEGDGKHQQSLQKQQPKEKGKDLFDGVSLKSEGLWSERQVEISVQLWNVIYINVLSFPHNSTALPAQRGSRWP